MEKFEEVLPDVWLLKVPFGIVWTGVILVRGAKTFLIDSSQEQPEEHLIPALDALGVKLSEIDWLLNTHSSQRDVNRHLFGRCTLHSDAHHQVVVVVVSQFRLFVLEAVGIDLRRGLLARLCLSGNRIVHADGHI